MGLVVWLVLIAGTDKSCEVRTAEVAPKIDGRIEQVWFAADTVDDLIQSSPEEGSTPSERTEVFVLQDAGNLYVAFRCHAERARPVAQLYGMEDEATVYLDPMDSRSMGYFFKIYGSGIWRQGLILDNGGNEDWSWEGVWYAAGRVYPDRFEAEFKIPFKSIRYNPDAASWGINFHRFIAQERENEHWTEVTEREGNQVSGYGRLTGVRPQAHGYYFELYPEGFLRYDQYADDTAGNIGDVMSRVKPRASLNFKWDLTPRTTLNATVLPDFAQIESDPYSFNLSRYPTHLSERRPFFVEGSELFRMTGLGYGPFDPLQLFYSRRIGKAVGQEPVPILAGLKLTTRSQNWSFGALGAHTNELADADGDIIEPRREFAVLSGRTTLRDRSNLGLLFGGTTAGEEDYNYAIGADWSHHSGPHRSTVQAALSDHNGRLGWALNSGYSGFNGSIATFGNLEIISDSFSVEDIGYVPWAGRKQFSLSAGPMVTGNGRGLRRLWAVPGVYFSQEPGSNDLSYGVSAYVEPRFRDWGFELDASAGHACEADTSYFGRNVRLEYEGGNLRYSLGLGGSYNYGYNYRQQFLANNYSDWAALTYYAAGRVAVMLIGTNWWEADPEGGIVSITSSLRPKIDYRINSTISFNVYSELVAATPGTEFKRTEILSNRIGFLFSWNFRPKSWLYVALNDYSADQTPFGEDGNRLSLVNRVGAVKVRYLFYF